MNRKLERHLGGWPFGLHAICADRESAFIRPYLTAFNGHQPGRMVHLYFCPSMGWDNAESPTAADLQRLALADVRLFGTFCCSGRGRLSFFPAFVTEGVELRKAELGQIDRAEFQIDHMSLDDLDRWHLTERGSDGASSLHLKHFPTTRRDKHFTSWFSLSVSRPTLFEIFYARYLLTGDVPEADLHRRGRLLDEAQRLTKIMPVHPCLTVPPPVGPSHWIFSVMLEEQPVEGREFPPSRLNTGPLTTISPMPAADKPLNVRSTPIDVDGFPHRIWVEVAHAPGALNPAVVLGIPDRDSLPKPRSPAKAGRNRP